MDNKMKQVPVCLLITAFFINNSFSQSVGIGTSSPNASAQLDISSNTKGILIPRMTEAEKTAVASPAQGLLIYNTSTNSFQYYNGVSWINITNSGIASGTNNRLAKFTGTWGLQNSLLTDNGSGVAVNSSGANADASSILDIASTSKGVLFPRMTTTQRNAIGSPASGLMILNTDTYRTNTYNGSSWTENGGASISLPYIDSSNTTYPDKLFSITNLGSGDAITGETRSAFGLAGTGVYGLASHATPSVMNSGVTGYNASTNPFGTGVYGYHNGNGTGVYGVVKGNGTAVKGYASSQFGGTGNGIGVEGTSTSNYGVYGKSQYSYGVLGESTNYPGVKAYSENHTGLLCTSSNYYGAYFENTSIQPTIYAINYGTGKAATLNGDVSIGGNSDLSGTLTVESGKGIVRSNTGVQLKLVRLSGNFAVTNLPVGASADATLNYEDFSAAPTITVAQVANGTGEWNKVMLTPYNVTATSCTIKVTNLASNAVTMTGTWHFIVVGAK